MLPQLPKKWILGEQLPFQESNVVEFKEVTVFSGLFRDSTLGKTGLTKYRETILGFLNCGKGLLIMGIKDTGVIVGVENLTLQSLDMLRLWIDSSFNTLIYTDGRHLDPTRVSIKMMVFPVSNDSGGSRGSGGSGDNGDNGLSKSVIVVEVINTGEQFNIMTRSGTIVHRLNASNFKICSEPVYRKRDVKGMIYSMQAEMRRALAEKKRIIDDLEEKHQEEIKRVIQAERDNVRAYIDKISVALYERYKCHNETSGSLAVVLIKYLLCMQ